MTFSKPLVTRLAPSPTGAQHLGNARTYLITWLLARRAGGRVVLRIEDIDSPRVKPGAAAQALDDLARALITLDPAPVLDAEESLATAVAALTAARASAAAAFDLASMGDPEALRDAAAAIRARIDRCRALGQSAADLTPCFSPRPAYTRTGAYPAAPAPPVRRASVS